MNWMCWFSTTHEIMWREITKIIINCNRNMSKNWMRLTMGILFLASRFAIALYSLSSLQMKERNRKSKHNWSEEKVKKTKKATQTTKALQDDVTRLRKVFSSCLTLLSHLLYLHYRSGLSDTSSAVAFVLKSPINAIQRTTTAHIYTHFSRQIFRFAGAVKTSLISFVKFKTEKTEKSKVKRFL